MHNQDWRSVLDEVVEAFKPYELQVEPSRSLRYEFFYRYFYDIVVRKIIVNPRSWLLTEILPYLQNKKLTSVQVEAVCDVLLFPLRMASIRREYFCQTLREMEN